MSPKRVYSVSDLPEVPGYISVARACAIMGIAKSSMFYKIYEQKAFRQVYRLSGEDDDARPTILMVEAEVLAVQRAEAEAVRQLPLHERVMDWNKRVKAWAAEHTDLWPTRVHAAGPPARELQMLYQQHVPQDPRPLE